MAKDLVIKATLDSQGVTKGADDAAQSLGKIKRQAELASKGLKALGDDKALNQVKEQFSSLGKQIDKFSQKMSSGISAKQQYRQLQNQLSEVALAYRQMSDAEKASATGKWMKQYMDELTVMGGKVADTVKDMQRQITAMSSDAPVLAGIAEGAHLIADGFTVAKGAASAFGLSEKKLGEIQKSMMSLMAMSNSLLNIKNALLNQSALRTAILVVRMKAQAIATAMQAAAEGKVTTATKAAAAAQALWNATIAANPIGATIAVLAAVVAAIVAYTSATKKANVADEEAKKAHKERIKELEDLAKATADSAGKQVAKFKMLSNEWKSLTSTMQKNNWIKQHQKDFKELGLSINSITQAENALVKNTDNYIQAMIARGKANAYLARIEAKTAKYIEERERPEKYKVYHEGESVSDTSGLVEGVDYRAVGRAIGSSIVGAVQTVTSNQLTKAGAAKMTARDEARAQRDWSERRTSLDKAFEADITRDANEMVKNTTIANKYLGAVASGGGGGTTTSSHGGGSTSTGKNDAPEGSLAYADKMIAYYTDAMKKATTEAAYNQADQLRMEWAKKRFWLDIELRLGKDAATKLQGELENLAESLKLTSIPFTDIIQMPSDIKLPDLSKMYKPFDDANARAQRLLESTEGLRMAGEAASGAFSQLSSAVGGNKVLDFTATLAQAIVTMIQGYATATAQAAEMGNPIAWLAFALTGLGTLLGMISSVKSAASYATGGIIQGYGTYQARNEGITLRAHEGEMMLNKTQQRNLFDAINGGFIGGNGGKVEFVISGKNLKGTLDNYNSTISRAR